MKRRIRPVRLLSERASEWPLALDRSHQRWMESGDSPLFRHRLRGVRAGALRRLAFLAGELATEFAHLALAGTVDRALAAALQTPSSPMTPFWNLVRQLAAGERPVQIRQRSWEFFLTKLALRRETGRFPTLEEVGERVGLTRERIRQIDLKMEQLLEPYEHDLAALRRFLISAGPMVEAALIVPPLEVEGWIVATDLLRRRGIHLNETWQSLSAHTERSVSVRLTKECTPFLRERTPESSVRRSHVEAMVGAWAAQRGYPPAVVPPVCRWACQELFDRHGEAWHWRGRQRRDLVEAVLLDYPEGYAIHRGLGALRHRANTLWPGAFRSDDAVRSAIELSPLCLLWGRGICIHQAHIRVQASDLKPIAQWLLEQFQRGVPQLSAFGVFARFADHLRGVGVPNAYGLYSCLRLFYGREFALLRFASILPAGTQERIRNEDALVAFLRAHGPQSIAAVRLEFRDRRGWKEDQITAAVQNSALVVSLRRGVIGLRDSDASTWDDNKV